MVKDQRKLQDNATRRNAAGYSRYELDKLIELSFAIGLAIKQAERIKINKVRIPLIDLEAAELLYALLAERIK